LKCKICGYDCYGLVDPNKEMCIGCWEKQEEIDEIAREQADKDIPLSPQEVKQMVKMRIEGKVIKAQDNKLTITIPEDNYAFCDFEDANVIIEFDYIEDPD